VSVPVPVSDRLGLDETTMHFGVSLIKVEGLERSYPDSASVSGEEGKIRLSYCRISMPLINLRMAESLIFHFCSFRLTSRLKCRLAPTPPVRLALTLTLALATEIDNFL
jgi:hypothetical protein